MQAASRCFVGPPFHAMPYARHVDYSASSIFINLTDTRKWFGKEKAQWHLNPRVQDKHKGKDGARTLSLPPACSARVHLLASWRMRVRAPLCLDLQSTSSQPTLIVNAGDWWHPKWWNADTKSGQAITLKNMEQVGRICYPSEMNTGCTCINKFAIATCNMPLLQLMHAFDQWLHCLMVNLYLHVTGLSGEL